MSLLSDDEIGLGNDSRYRAYVLAIENILRQYKSTSEWADFIPYLAKIKRTIENNSQYSYIPKRITLFKHLAQCLHPALPAGVHLNTLEVYETIFRIVDKQQLQRDIILYAYGLFSLLPVANISIKSNLLQIYDNYFLPFGDGLNPVLTGFLIGLFSSLEEGAEYFDRIINLLDKLANRIDEFYFYTCLWSAIHLVPSVRYQGSLFILNHFDRQKNLTEQFHLIGLSIDTMIAATCTCLYDNDQSLAQRTILDFILLALPIHKKQLNEIYLKKILDGALHVLSKRDMGLNRRIYEWFFGSNESNDSLTYFIDNIREMLIETLKNALVQSTWPLTKLIRILLVLVDKPDVGPNIIESIFLNYLITIYEHVYQPLKNVSKDDDHQPDKIAKETMKTFLTLLDTLEPYFIWDYLMKNFELILVNTQSTIDITLEQICEIIHMLIDLSLSNSSIDLLSEHLPEMFCRLMKTMHKSIEFLQPNQIILCLELLSNIFQNLNLNPTEIDYNPTTDDDTTIECLLKEMVEKVNKQLSNQSIRNQLSRTMSHYIDESIEIYKDILHCFIETKFIDRNQMNLKSKFQQFHSIIQVKTNENLSKIFNRYQQSSEFDLKLNDNIEQYQSSFEQACKLFIRFLSFSSKNQTEFDDCLIDLCTLSLGKINHFSFQILALSVLIELFKHNRNRTHLFALTNETDFFQYIIAYLWEYLNEDYTCDFHKKSTMILANLELILPMNLCENLISKQLSFVDIYQTQNYLQTIDDYKRFFQLWNRTRQFSCSFQQPLIQVLSSLKQTNQNCIKNIIHEWITHCFIRGDICRIFDILLLMLLHSDTTRIPIRQYNSSTEQDSTSNSNVDHEMTFALVFDDDELEDENQGENEIEPEETDDGKQNRTNSNLISSEKTSPQLIKPQAFTSFAEPIVSNLLSFSPPFVSRSLKSRALTIRNTNQSATNLSNSSSPRFPPMPIDEPSVEEFQDTLILLYAQQTFNFKPISLALNIIEYLFDLLPQQLIQTLLTTSTNDHENRTMLKMFFKHIQTFTLINDTNREYLSYLYILLKTLLIYTFSYCSKTDHIEENCQIQMQCLVLLTRICHDLSYKCIDNSMIVNYVVNLLKKVSFQKILSILFNRINQNDLLKTQVHLHKQLSRQYLKQLIQLIEEIILLEYIILSNDSNLISQPIVSQTIFISIIVQYLKQIQTIENHRYMIDLIVRILPHCGSSLKMISIKIIEQICRNLCFLVQYQNQQNIKTKFKCLSSFDVFYYIIYFIQRLSYICNYCLGNTTNPSQNFNQPLCPLNWMKKIKINQNDISDARQAILAKLSSIMSSSLFIWKHLPSSDHSEQIRETIIEFFSSLTKTNGLSFIRTVIKCWNNERKKQQKISEEIQALIHILIQIKTYSLHDMIYHMNELVRNDKKKSIYNSWCLQFLVVYFEEMKNVTIDCWSILAGFLKECLAQSTSSSNTFLIIKILSIYVEHSLSLIEKRDLKDLQEIIMKALENCNSIVSSSLKHPRWLRKTLQGRLPQPDLDSAADSSTETETSPETENDENSQSSNSSLTALTILSEHAPKLVDTVCNLTDEKDRLIIPYLQSLVTNVMPYVRTHNLSTASFYRSATNLLFNLSQYSYTKKTWKKEVLEQLFDTNFFQVDLVTLRQWKTIIDRISTKDKPLSFRDLMTRINAVQTGLFVSKDQEYEQRAMLIKRLAFVIYSSEKDQFTRNLPDILGFISDLLKSSQIPIINAQIFLLLRVLVLRISSKILSSFWPTFMSELIQIFLQIEQDILNNENENDTAKCNLQRLTMNELTSTTNTQATYKMYLYACKLLDILLAMPYADIEYFQFVRFAFAADYGITSQLSTTDTFLTYSIRLTKLLESKFGQINSDNLPSTFPLLRQRTLSNLNELYRFFNSLSIYNKFNYSNEQLCLTERINEIETSVLEDFVESWS